MAHLRNVKTMTKSLQRNVTELIWLVPPARALGLTREPCLVPPVALLIPAGVRKEFAAPIRTPAPKPATAVPKIVRIILAGVTNEVLQLTVRW